LHFFSAEITYGVVPDAAMPITMSFSEILYFWSDNQPSSLESSANSTAFLMAVSPPAIRPRE